MAPTVQYADPDERGTRIRGIETGFMDEQGGLLSRTGAAGDEQQGGEILSLDKFDQGLLGSETACLNDGRRRSSRLRGKVPVKNSGPGDESQPVIKVARGSGKKGRRKKSTGHETLQNSGELVDEQLTDVVVEDLKQETILSLEVARASLADGESIVRCGVLSTDTTQQEEVSEVKALKVKRLEDLGVLDKEVACEDKEVTVRIYPKPSLDVCDSKIYDNLHNVLPLNPEENVLQSEALGTPGENGGSRLESEAPNFSHFEVTPEVVKQESTGDIVLSAGLGGSNESSDMEVTTLTNSQRPSCDTALPNSDDRRKSTEPGCKMEVGFGESNDNILRAGECNKDGCRLDSYNGEDSSSVTSRDGVAFRASASEGRVNEGISSEKGAGFSVAVYKDSNSDDVLLGTLSSELLVEESSQVRPRKGLSRHAEEPHEEAGHSGLDNSLDARSLEITLCRNRASVHNSQVGEKEDVAEQKDCSSTLEGLLSSQVTVAKSGSVWSEKGKQNQVTCAEETVQKDDLDGIGESKVQVIDAIVDFLPYKKCRNVGNGRAAVCVNVSRRKTGVVREDGAEVHTSEMAENSPLKNPGGLGKYDSTQCERECSTQLSKKTDSLKSVNQETGGSGGDAPDTVKVESSTGLVRSLARHLNSTAVGEDDSSGVTEEQANTIGEKVDESVGITSKACWVKCDDCDKWRSIPVELAEQIEEASCHWSCSQNPNKQFADCSIPQVKSNDEINQELGISESSLCDDGDDVDATGDSRPMCEGTQENGQAVWTLLRRNIFKHRSQKHQDVDEAMVCQCTRPRDGEVACGEDCLNRMLNIECLAQQCPCGSSCTNQQFQKRSYANVELFRCGKKGHGLLAKENIEMGTFIIEYVGEVLDMPSFELRQQEYAVNLQKHFYFMTLSSNEVIDACSKGNLGRFINHSCEPNCRTEKWMVDGEVCIGLFAIRDVEKGEEITFDYNFVRVGGAVAKKCECGAPNCRGFIGVDPDTPHTVVEIESEDGEDPEPIMLVAESDDEIDSRVHKMKEQPVRKASMVTGSGTTDREYRGVKRKLHLAGVKDVKNSRKVKRVKTTAMSKLSSYELSRGFTGANGSRLGARNNYRNEVEEKLSELTYQSGGLKNRKDTAKQFLKLLVLTAVSGVTVNGAAACSVRDLSMLLEALLKTEKLAVMKDIMNKNGFQIFHNLLKQFRKLFEKRPMLRKLLKVLDHLAKCKALTVEHIYSPPRSGMECFSDTLFELTRHDDLEVQNMARSFRRLYVPPRPPRTDLITDNSHKQSSSIQPQSNNQLLKKQKDQLQGSRIGDLCPEQSDRAKVNLASHQPPTLTDIAQTAGSVVETPPITPVGMKSADHGAQAEGNVVNAPITTKRKRPSRWDTPKTPDGAGVGGFLLGIPNSVGACGRSTIISQTGLTSLSPSHEHSSKRDCRQSSRSLKPPRVTLHEAVHRQHSGLAEPDKATIPPRGINASSSPIPPGSSMNSSVCSASSEILRRPAGPVPSGQLMLVQTGGPQHQLYRPGLIPMGMLGQKPILSHGSMESGMQAESLCNDLPVGIARLPFPGDRPNLFQGGTGHHPNQAFPALIPTAGMHPLSFGFPPGHPSRGVSQPTTTMPGAPPLPWPMMHRGGDPIFAGQLPFPPGPPHLPAWSLYGPPQMEGYQGPASTSNSEALESCEDQVKQGFSAPQSCITRSENNEHRDCEGATEPPVPGLSPVRLQNSLTSQKPANGTTMSQCSQGSHRPHNQLGPVRGGTNDFPKHSTGSTTNPHMKTVCSDGRSAHFVVTHTDRYGLRQPEHGWAGPSHQLVPSDNRYSTQQANRQTGDSKGRQKSAESQMGCPIQSWDTPDCADFHHHVSTMVRNRVELKRLINPKDVEKFCSKLTEVVTRKEINKFKENKLQGVAKPIHRARVLEKVDTYVDLQIEIYVKRKTGEGQL